MSFNKTILSIVAVLIISGFIFWYTGFRNENLNNLSDQSQSVPSATSADNAPPGSIHNLPVPEAVAAAKAYAAQIENAELGKVIVLTAYEKTWPDGCLGLAKKDEFCTQALVPGWEVTISANGKVHVYRTNSDGSAIREQ